MMWSSRNKSFSGGKEALHISTTNKAPAAQASRMQDTEQQPGGDSDQADHEQPVHPPRTGDVLVDAGERAEEPLRNPSVGLPPLIQASSDGISCPSPNILSRNGHRNIQPMQSRVIAQTYRAAVS